MNDSQNQYFIKKIEKLNDKILWDKISYKFLVILFFVFSFSSISYTNSTVDNIDDSVAVMISSIIFTLTNSQSNKLNLKQEEKLFLKELLKTLEIEKNNDEENVKTKKYDRKI